MAMRVAMISNNAWLDEELATLQQLAGGLAEAGVQAVQVLPNDLDPDEAAGMGDCVGWADSAWSSLRSLRLRRLADRLEELDVDVVHALDGRLWTGALQLARRMDVPSVLTAGSRTDVALAERLRPAIERAKAVVIATTIPLGDALGKALGPDVPLHVIHPGVPAPENPPAPFSTGEGIFCAAVCGSGIYDADCQAFFEALPTIIEEFPQGQFFLDGQGRDQHPLWQAARKHKLLANVSMVPRRLGRRELLLRADLLIQPQPLGRSRGLVLQALARGVPVLACADPWLDYLVDDQSAWLVESPTPEGWQELLRRAAGDAPRARALGGRARHWVRPRHDLAGQVNLTARVYRQLTGQVIRFPG
ncbi:MAG: glycosyltransferase family 4 protein [Planctomycetota bacterium]|nr:glycosyltransferase family 4 protein [Planctomycetota bacterium]